MTNQKTVLSQPWLFVLECGVLELENLVNGNFAYSSAPYSDFSPSEIKRLAALLLQEDIPDLLKPRLQVISNATGALGPLWGEGCAVRFKYQTRSVLTTNWRRIGEAEADRRYLIGSQKRFWFLSGFLASL